MRGVNWVVCLFAVGCSWTTGVTGAPYLRLDGLSGGLLLIALPLLCQALIGRSWGRCTPSEQRPQVSSAGGEG